MSYAPPSHWAIPYPQHAPPIQSQAGYANVVQHAPAYPPTHYAGVPPAAAPPYGYPPVDAKGPDHPGYTVAAQPYAPQAMGAQPAATLYQTGLGTTAACTHESIDLKFNTPGILLMIFCFPLGILCAMGMRDKICRQCGAMR